MEEYATITTSRDMIYHSNGWGTTKRKEQTNVWKYTQPYAWKNEGTVIETIKQRIKCLKALAMHGMIESTQRKRDKQIMQKFFKNS